MLSNDTSMVYALSSSDIILGSGGQIGYIKDSYSGEAKDIFNDNLKRLDYGAFLNNDITKVTIGSDVILETKVFGNDNDFRDAYYINGAGTYIYEDGIWVKQ